MYSIYAGDELLYSDVYPNESRKVTSPTLKMAVDEAGSLEFTLSEQNVCYEKLKRMKTIITVKKDNTPIWDGRIIEEYRDFNKNKKMYVEGSLTFLNDSCQPLKEYQNVSLETLVTAILDIHNKTVKDDERKLYWGGVADSFTPPQLEYWSTKYESTIETIKNLAEYVEGHFIVIKDPSTFQNKIIFFKDEIKNATQTIVFGKNLLDYTEDFNLSKLATVLLPLAQTDREPSDKPVNVGTTIDLTVQTPDEDYERQGWAVVCPLTRHWYLNTDLNGRLDTIASRGGYYTSMLGGIQNTINIENSTLNPDAQHKVYPNYGTGTDRIYTTDIIPLGEPALGPEGAHNRHTITPFSYIVVFEDIIDEHNAFDNWSLDFYYKPRGSSTWERFTDYVYMNSTYNIYRDMRGSILTNRFLEFTFALNNDGYIGGGGPFIGDKDIYRNDWAVQISFRPGWNEYYDSTAELFASRVRKMALYRMVGYHRANQDNSLIPASVDVWWSAKHMSNTLSSDENTYSGLVNKRNRLLNLKKNQNGTVSPVGVCQDPMIEVFNNETYRAFYSDTKVFTSDVKAYKPQFTLRKDTKKGSLTYEQLIDDESIEDIVGYDRTPFTDLGQQTAHDLGFEDADAAKVGELAALNWGAIHYWPVGSKNGSTAEMRNAVAVLKINREKYSSYYLTTTIKSVSGPAYSTIGSTMAASVWNIKNDDNIPTWTTYRSRDLNPNFSGMDYIIGPYDRRYMIGRKFDPETLSTSDTIEDAENRFYMLNPDKYVWNSADEITKICFEKEMFLPKINNPNFTNDLYLALYTSNNDLSVTIATDEEKDSVIAIGMDSNGIDLTKEYPKRHSDDGVWQPDNQDHVYGDLRYGTLCPPLERWRLVNVSEYEALEYKSPNVWLRGGYYPKSSYAGGDNESGFKTPYFDSNPCVRSVDNTNYKCCAIFVKPSWKDVDGTEYPRSIYITTAMYGKSGMYAIFELSDGSGNSTTWSSGSWKAKCREIEYGKYINGVTNYDKKKILLPYCKDKETLLLVIVASYSVDPNIWLFDPDLAEKNSYLTIAGVNNGDMYLMADTSNKFTSMLEQGNLNDQNGSVDLVHDDNTCRTMDFITIQENSPYVLSYEAEDVRVKWFVYDENEKYLYSSSGFRRQDPVVYMGIIGSNRKVKFKFIKSNGSYVINPSEIKNIQLYSLTTSGMGNMNQGRLMARAAAHGYDIVTNSSEVYAGKYLSSSEYYVATTTDMVVVQISTTRLPKTITIDGEEKEILNYAYYTCFYYQEPLVYEDPTTGERITYYGTVKNSVETLENYITFRPPVVNTRLKFQFRVLGEYAIDGGTTWTTLDITPDMIDRLTVSPLIKKNEYVPPNNAYETYGRIERRVEFSDVSTSQELLERAKKYMRQSQFDEMNLKVKALDMEFLGADSGILTVGDKITVSSPPHGLYKNFIIREMSIPFDNPANTTFELGWDNKDSLTKIIRGDKSKWQ